MCSSIDLRPSAALSTVVGGISYREFFRSRRRGRVSLSLTYVRAPRRASFRLCHRQGHFLYHPAAQIELNKHITTISPASCWRACHPPVKAAGGRPRATFQGLKHAGKPPSQSEASPSTRCSLRASEGEDHRVGKNGRQALCVRQAQRSGKPTQTKLSKFLRRLSCK